MNAVTQRNLARFAIIIALLASLIMLIYGLVQLFQRPSIGADWDARSVVYQAVPASQLQVGDQILTIDGQPEATSSFPYYQWRRGDIIEFELVRDGQTLQIAQSYDQPPTSTESIVNLSVWIVAAAFWIAGSLVTLRSHAPRQQNALFSLSCAFICTALAGGIPIYFLWVTLVALTCSIFAVATLIHFHVIFPRPLLQLKRWQVACFYAIPTSIAVLNWLDRFQASRGQLATESLLSVADLLFNVWVTLGLISIPLLLGYSLFAAQTQADRRQLGIVLASCIFAFMPMLMFSILPTIILGRPFISTQFTFAPLIALVSGYSYAIFQRKLIRLDQYISRSVSIMLVFGVLTLFYLLITFSVNNWLTAYPGIEPLANLGAALLLAIVFSPLRQRLQRLSDNLLYGGWYDYSSVVDALTHQLDEAQSNIATLAETFCATIQQTMRVKYVALLLPDPDSESVSVYESGGSENLAHPVGQLLPEQISGLGTLLAASGQPLATDMLRDALEEAVITAEETTLLKHPTAHLWMSVPGRHATNGILVLGSKLGGDLFDRNDFGILQVVSRQIGMAYQNLQLIRELERKADETARYRRELVRAREEERKRLSHDLHDVLIQQLVGMKYQLSTLQARLTGNDEAAMEIESLEHNFVTLIETTRTMCHTLRPPALNLGLIPAIRSTLKRFEHDHGIDFTLNILGEQPRVMPEAIELCIFRCTNEALANAWKHASASSIDVTLCYADATVEWTLRDDGCGFEMPEHLGRLMEENHFGIVSMRERVELVNGQFHIDSFPSQGTRLSACIPLS